MLPSAGSTAPMNQNNTSKCKKITAVVFVIAEMYSIDINKLLNITLYMIGVETVVFFGVSLMTMKDISTSLCLDLIPGISTAQRSMHPYCEAIRSYSITIAIQYHSIGYSL